HLDDLGHWVVLLRGYAVLRGLRAGRRPRPVLGPGRPCDGSASWTAAGQPAVTSVPLFSPLIAWVIDSSPSMPKTSIGSSLSMHRLNAAASTTRRLLDSASPKVSRCSFTACGSVRGSPV